MLHQKITGRNLVSHIPARIYGRLGRCLLFKSAVSPFAGLPIVGIICDSISHTIGSHSHRPPEDVIPHVQIDLPLSRNALLREYSLRSYQSTKYSSISTLISHQIVQCSTIGCTRFSGAHRTTGHIVAIPVYPFGRVILLFLDPRNYNRAPYPVRRSEWAQRYLIAPPVGGQRFHIDEYPFGSRFPFNCSGNCRRSLPFGSV